MAFQKSGLKATQDYTNQSQVRKDYGDIKVGIFYADSDVNKAEKIKKEFEDRGCETKLFNFYQAGQPKMGYITQFIIDHDLIIWIATATSLQNDGLLKAAKEMAQYADTDMKEIIFVCFQPEGHIKVKLPLELGAFTTLIEDEKLDERLDATLESVRKLILGRKDTKEQSSYVVNYSNDLC